MAAASPDVLAGRVARVRAHLRDAQVDALLVSHLPNLTYLTGLRASAGCLLLAEDRAWLVLDFRYAAAGEAAADRLRGVGAELLVADRSLEEALADLVRRAAVGRVGVEAAHLPLRRFEWLRDAFAGSSPAPALVSTERLVERERAVKGPEEVAALREGGRRIAAVARDLGRYVRANRSEREVAADLDHAVRLAGFERAAFDTIVASGPLSALPHARPTTRILEPGDPVVLDFGGVYDGYCVDLTRTASVGPPGSGLERLHVAVLEALQAALEAVRPGVTAAAVDAAARGALSRHGLAGAFGHGTGHGLGLEVHEEPRIGRPVAGQPAARLAPGMAFTIEPGVYVPGVGGVRIEDDVLVTTGGYELLTEAPRSLFVV